MNLPLYGCRRWTCLVVCDSVYWSNESVPVQIVAQSVFPDVFARIFIGFVIIEQIFFGNENASIVADFFDSAVVDKIGDVRRRNGFAEMRGRPEAGLFDV